MRKIISCMLILALLISVGTIFTNVATASSISTEISAKKPVILVPGMMGSHLYSFEGVSNGQNTYNHRWFDTADCLLDPWDNHLNPLRLSPDGVNPFMSTYQIYTSKRIGGYTQQQINNGLLDGLLRDKTGSDIWNALIEELERNGYQRGVNLFAAPFDWRYSISTRLNSLQEVIDIAKQRSGWNKVDIIAHSMGGLLTKKYLLTSAANRGNVHKFISLGSPYLGSVKSMAALTIGDSFCFIDPLIGINDNKVRELVKNYKSSYELMPSRKYFELVVSNPYYYKYGSKTWTSYFYENSADMDGDGDDTEYLDFDEIKEMIRRRYNSNASVYNSNDIFHNGFDGQSVVKDGVKHYVVAGSSLPTLYTMEAHDPWYRGLHFDEINFNIGDATVPFPSACDLGNPNITQKKFVYEVDHMKLPVNPEVITYIKQVLSSTTSTAAEKSDDEAEVLKRGINGTIILVKSDKSPTVYNKTNKSLKIGYVQAENGLKLLNTIEKGSYIQTLGEMYIVYVPGQLKDYGIEVAGTSVASIQAREYAATQVIKKDTIENLNLNNTNSTILLNFNEATSKLNIVSK